MFVWVDVTRSMFELQCEVDRNSVSAGRGATEYSFLCRSYFSLFSMLYNHNHCLIPEHFHHPKKKLYALLCCLSPIVWVHKVNCCLHCPWPHINQGNAGNEPTCPSGAIHQEHHSRAPGPAVGAKESAQILAPPLHACAHKALRTCPSHRSTNNLLGYPAGTEPLAVAEICRSNSL